MEAARPALQQGAGYSKRLLVRELPRIGPERSLDPRRDFGAPVSIKTIMLLQ